MGSAHINAKERQMRRVKKRKGVEEQRVRYPATFRATDALIR